MAYLFILVSCNSKVKDEQIQDNILFEIIFADGFKSDLIEFKVNQDFIIKSTLTSDESDGLTSLAYKILKKGDKIVLINSYEENKMHYVKNHKILTLSVFYKAELFDFQIDKTKGKYILIESTTNKIQYTQQSKKPLFD